MQNLPRPAIEPMSPALIGGFLMTGLPGKSGCSHFQKDKKLCIFLDQQNRQLELRCLWLIPGVPAWNVTISGKVKMPSYRLSTDDQCSDLSCQELSQKNSLSKCWSLFRMKCISPRNMHRLWESRMNFYRNSSLLYRSGQISLQIQS